MRLLTLAIGLSLVSGVLTSHPRAALADDEPLNSPSPTVSIEGAIVHPGSYDLKPGWGLDDLILAAGKMTILADTARVELSRKGEATRRIDLQKHFAPGKPKLALAHDDHVVVPKMEDRVVLVGVPGGGFRPLVRGQRISDFFGIAEHTVILDTTKVDVTKTVLRRRGKRDTPIDLKKVMKNPRAKQNVLLHSGDVIWLQSRMTALDCFGGGIRELAIVARFIAWSE